jgi:uncharacterized SAM-binding protein YcdF (DUF218 family)
MAESRGQQTDGNESAAASPGKTKSAFLGAVAGLSVGALIGLAFSEISLGGANTALPGIGAAIGLILGLLHFQKLLGTVAGVVAVGLLVIAYTPLVGWLVSQPPEGDPLQKADAVVALGAGIFSDGSLGCHSRDRSLHALELLREGYASELVVPAAADSWGPAVREQMGRLGLNFPVDQPGTVANTHDEAMVVSQLAAQRGWKRVILVTNAWHMRRAAGCFRKLGLDIVRSPCSDSCADMIHPTTLVDRLRAFGCWLHETVGYGIYKMRGWIE